MKVAKGVVAPTKRGKALGNKPTEEWWILFVSCVRDLKWSAKRWPPERRWFWVDEVASLWRHYLESMRTDQRGIDIEMLRDQAWSLVKYTYDVDDLTPVQIDSQRSMIESSIRWGFFEPLSMLNAIDPATINSKILKPTALGKWAAERFGYVMEGRSQAGQANETDNVVWLRQRARRVRSMFTEVIAGKLWRSRRPGYLGERGAAVPPTAVDEWTDQLEAIWRAHQALPKPVVVHCSAGVDRTGSAIGYIQQQLGQD